jgi:hypothetical protein
MCGELGAFSIEESEPDAHLGRHLNHAPAALGRAVPRPFSFIGGIPSSLLRRCQGPSGHSKVGGDLTEGIGEVEVEADRIHGDQGTNDDQRRD